MTLCCHVIYNDHEFYDWLAIMYTIYFGTFSILAIMLPDFRQKYMNYVAYS